jgi:GNAT superfamily N-acetyltransferase
MKLELYNPLRNPEYADLVIDALLEESAELKGTEIDCEHVKNMLATVPTIKCLIALDEEELLGTIILAVSPLWYAPKEIVARDLLVWVAPEHRGGSTFIRMIKAVESWALRANISRLYLSQSTGIEVERTARLYEKLGYSVSGFLSSKRIK